MNDITPKPVSWPESVTLTPTEQQINRWLDKLDEASREFEARWGCDRLPTLVPTDLAERWARQWQKLNEAITARYLDGVAELAGGCIRGWQALEDSALRAGQKPIDPDCWEARHAESGQVYRIVRNRDHARALGSKTPNVQTWTLEEVINVLETRARVPFPEKRSSPSVANSRSVDWVNGDSLEF